MNRKSRIRSRKGDEPGLKRRIPGDDPLSILAERHNVCGLTMIEVLIASTVLTIGLLGMVAMQGRSMRGIGYSRHVSNVTTLLESKAEEMRLLAWDHPDLAAGNHVDPQNPLTEIGSAPSEVEYPENERVPSAIFNRLWSVTDIDEEGNGSIDRKDVAFTLTWRHAGDHAVTIITSIARH
ncbi:prepilin-type N-terminal cleavage/methylation domain-containing protein [Thermodesulfobacteriota bacterium]